MIEDYCPGCGDLLSKDKICSLCNYSYSVELLDISLIDSFDWVKEGYDISNFIDD